MALKLGLVKGGTVKIRCQRNMPDVKFRASGIEDGYYAFTSEALVAGFPGVEVKLSVK